MARKDSPLVPAPPGGQLTVAVDLAKRGLSILRTGAETLRGSFVHPDLIRQGQILRIGRGYAHKLIPLSAARIVGITSGGAELLDLATGDTLWTIDNPANCGDMARDGRWLALGGGSGIDLWDLRQGRWLSRLEGRGEWVQSVAFSADGRLLASSSEDETVCLWDTATGAMIRRLEGHGEWVSSIAFAPDGRLLASGSRDCTVCLWDAVTGKEVDRLQLQGTPWHILFSPDGGRIAAACGSAGCYLWDIAVRQPIRLSDSPKWALECIAFNSDGHLFALGCIGTVYLWDAFTGARLHSMESKERVTSVAFSPEENKLFSAGLGIRSVWDADTGQLIQQLESQEGLFVAFIRRASRWLKLRLGHWHRGTTVDLAC